MLKCLECGNVFDEYDLKYVEDPIGLYGEATVYEHYWGCPCCESSDYVEYDDIEEEEIITEEEM